MLFPALRVMAAGDIFSGKNIPFLDYNNGGSGVDIPDTLMKAYTATAKNVDSIVTGHSTVMTPADLREYADFNRDFLNAVREAKKSGQDGGRVRQELDAAGEVQRLRTDIGPSAGQCRRHVQGDPVADRMRSVGRSCDRGAGFSRLERLWQRMKRESSSGR